MAIERANRFGSGGGEAREACSVERHGQSWYEACGNGIELGANGVGGKRPDAYRVFEVSGDDDAGRGGYELEGIDPERPDLAASGLMVATTTQITAEELIPGQ
jgi:hypothetical protein